MLTLAHVHHHHVHSTPALALVCCIAACAGDLCETLINFLWLLFGYIPAVIHAAMVSFTPTRCNTCAPQMTPGAAETPGSMLQVSHAQASIAPSQGMQVTYRARKCSTTAHPASILSCSYPAASVGQQRRGTEWNGGHWNQWPGGHHRHCRSISSISRPSGWSVHDAVQTLQRHRLPPGKASARGMSHPAWGISGGAPTNGSGVQRGCSHAPSAKADALAIHGMNTAAGGGGCAAAAGVHAGSSVTLPSSVHHCSFAGSMQHRSSNSLKM